MFVWTKLEQDFGDEIEESTFAAPTILPSN